MDVEKVPAADCAAGIADAIEDDGFEYYVPPVFPGGIDAKDLALGKMQDCDHYLRGMADMAPTAPCDRRRPGAVDGATEARTNARSMAVRGGEPLGEAEAGEVAARGEAGAARVAAVEPREHVATPAADRRRRPARSPRSSRSTRRAVVAMCTTHARS